jgi:RNase H-fold protein (predicted Holliday junction resolvase)
LRAGYYTALLAIILLLLFRSKRRQRIILVIAPLRNTTMEFVDTVTQLYINKSNHRDIALKMVSQFLEYVRGRFGLPTGMLDEDFTKRLAARSGMETGKVGEIIGRIQQVRSGESVKGTELLALDRAIDEFKKMAT